MKLNKLFLLALTKIGLICYGSYELGWWYFS